MNLDQIYEEIKLKKIETALDLIFDWIDDLLLEGNFSKVDEILSQIELDKLESNSIIGFLCITSAAKGILKNRKAFYNACHEYFILTDPNRAERLLIGLK